MQFTNRTILITGGNSGIGRGMAEALMARGNQVIITGRKSSSLVRTLADNPEMVGYPLDVTEAGAIERFVGKVIEDHPNLDAVILNAGIMEPEILTGPAPSTDVAERTIETNLLAPIRLTAALLPHLRSRPEAALVTVTSGLAFVPLGATPTYSATKAAMHSWSQAMRTHLRDTSVSVHEIAPPMVATELTPGQSKREAAMPLDSFVNDIVAQLSDGPAPDEVMVERSLYFRNAEAEGRYPEVYEAVNNL